MLCLEDLPASACTVRVRAVLQARMACGPAQPSCCCSRWLAPCKLPKNVRPFHRAQYHARRYHKRTLQVRASLSQPTDGRPRPPKMQTYRGYLGDTRSKKSRYSDAAVDQEKEDNRENMRTVSCGLLACQQCLTSTPAKVYSLRRCLTLNDGQFTEALRDTFST